jgi:hypothetical protein
MTKVVEKNNEDFQMVGPIQFSFCFGMSCPIFQKQQLNINTK